MTMEASTSESTDSIVKEHAFLISMQFGVLRRILSYLPARDLGQAALVCHAWNDVCRIIRRGRQVVHWFEWHGPKVGRKMNLPSPRDQINEEYGRVLCEPNLCLFFSSALVNSLTDYGLNEGVCATENGLSFCDYMDEIACVCAPAIHHLMSMMPRTCFAIGLRVYGTIGTPKDLSPVLELKEKASLSVLLIPKIPGVLTRPFVVERETFRRVTSGKLKQGILSDAALEELTGISPKEEVRCLLLFCDSADGEDAAELIVNSLMERMNQKMAVGGGIGDQFYTNTSTLYPILMGVAISGESVRAVSTVISQKVTKYAEIDEFMQKLKSCNMPSENCFGFMFSCMGRRIGRGRGNKGSESSLFRTHFPSVPLVGFFGSGEIGVDHLVSCDSQDGNSPRMDTDEVNEPLSKKHKIKKYKVLHEYSTIMVLVSLRKGKRQNND